VSRCGKCGTGEAKVHLHDGMGEGVNICEDCYNVMMADFMDIENFDDYRRWYQAQDVDVDGVYHDFEIRKMIYHAGILWEAAEIVNGEECGYKFAVNADFEDDTETSLQKLYEKIHRGLSKKYVTEKTIEGQCLFSLPKDEIKGRIEWG